MSAALLTSNNHELHALVRARIEAQYPLGFIAQELDVEVQELIDWIMDVYKASPPDPKKYQNRGYAPIGKSRGAGGNGWSMPAQVRRQTTWEKQRAGAVEARKANA